MAEKSPYRYSQSTGCFYPVDLEYSVLPEDLIDVSEADYRAAMSRDAGVTGLQVIDGRIIVVPAVQPTDDELLSRAKKVASRAIHQAISDQEALQARPLREIVLGLDSNGAAKARVITIDSRITALREQLAYVAAVKSIFDIPQEI